MTFSGQSKKMMNSSWQSSLGSVPLSLLAKVTYIHISEPEFVADAPEHELSLEFINGFKVEDSRQNMFWGHNPNEIVYCAAAVGVVMNSNTLKQRYMGAG